MSVEGNQSITLGEWERVYSRFAERGQHKCLSRGNQGHCLSVGGMVEPGFVERDPDECLWKGTQMLK